MRKAKNTIVIKIYEKFGWTLTTYANRRGLDGHNLKRFVYGGTKGMLKGSKAEQVLETLLSDGIVYN